MNVFRDLKCQLIGGEGCVVPWAFPVRDEAREQPDEVSLNRILRTTRGMSAQEKEEIRTRKEQLRSQSVISASPAD